MKKIRNFLHNSIIILFLVLFVPILVSTILVGNRWDYPDYYKLNLPVDNMVLAMIGLFLIGLFYFGVSRIKGSKWEQLRLEGKNNRIANALLMIYWVGILLINIYITICIIFKSAWADPVNVKYSAEVALSGLSINTDTWYYKVYPNNVPMVYVCLLIQKVLSPIIGIGHGILPGFIIANCFVVSATGWLVCMTVKEITGNLMNVLVALVAYTACVAQSPWKVFTYTDIYGMLFPMLTLYLYACYRKLEKGDKQHKKHILKKAIYWLSICVCGFLAVLVKTTCCSCIIAILIMEFIEVIFGECVAPDKQIHTIDSQAHTLDSQTHTSEMQIHISDSQTHTSDKQIHDSSALKLRVRNLGIYISMALLAGGMIFVLFKGHIYKVLQYETDDSLRITWTSYFNMGANEEYFGTCNGEDTGEMFGRYQDSKERRSVELSSALQRIQDRGIWGNIAFYHKKLVMTFNDGTFSWFREGNSLFFDSPYEGTIQGKIADWLRNVYWENGKGFTCFRIYSQCVWLMIMIGMFLSAADILWLRNKGEKKPGTFQITVILIIVGAILFQMLFETRARYLICSLPIMITLVSMNRFKKI